MGKLAIGVFPGVVGNMVYDFSLKFAEAAKEKGHDVSVWFSGNASGSITAKQKHLKDYSTAEQHITRLIENGVEICTCEACSLARGVKKDVAIEGVLWSAMHWYLAKVYNADRVLQIGGE